MHPAPPLNASGSPFSIATPLFRTMIGESLNSQQAQSSPFAVPATSNTGSPLTVGDVLPQLPPDVARFGALSPDQPVAVSPQILDAALRSGQAALPIFEIYRVCPALFQTPISPQDPRMVPLPASKLPRLIATAQQAPNFEVMAPNRPTAPQDSPFSAVLEPFSAVQGSAPAATALPPRRQGPPPPLADLPGRDVSQLSLPEGATPAIISAFPGNPFLPNAAVDSPGPSPFGIKPEDPLPAQANLFAPQPLAGTSFASPFETAASPGPASPFGTVTPSAAASPFGAPVASSPFGASAPAPVSPFGQTLSPAGTGAVTPQQEPRTSGFFAGASSPAAPEPPSQTASAQPYPAFPAFGTATPPGETRSIQPSDPSTASSLFAAPKAAAVSPFPSAQPASASSTTFRVSLSSLLKGYTVAELGFDPVVVPAWIMTSLPTAFIREQMASGNPTTELGMVVDGISDIGFRNVLSQVKRDFRLQLPIPELTSAMASSAPAAAPHVAGGSGVGQVVQPSSGATMRIEPPAQTPASSPEAAGFAPAASFLAPAPRAETSEVKSVVPLFSEAPPSAFTRPAEPTLAAPPILPTFPVPVAPAPVAKTADPFAAGPAATPPATAPKGWPPTSSDTVEEAPEPFSPPSGHPFNQPPVRVGSQGLSSAELLGGGNTASPPPEPAWIDPAAPARQQPPPARASAFQDAPPAVPLFAERAPPAPLPAAVPVRSTPPPVSAAPKPGSSSSVGLRPLDTQTEQILLRALLGTDEDLTPRRIVEMTSLLPGIAACVCLKGDQVLSHAGAHKPQAREFQRQATDLAHHLRTLGPLIGIDGAETFTLNAGDRLMTFCFPDAVILGVLHDEEPTLGLRDKITLIARELSRMLA
ncbi:MAG: hypothetical protein U0984_05240 [Prosthecobacter sp.]|nr:hypothetical protein [Prosthecobacter sp.]